MRITILHRKTGLILILLSIAFICKAQQTGGWEIEVGISYGMFDRYLPQNKDLLTRNDSEIISRGRNTTYYVKDDHPSHYKYFPKISPTLSVTAGYVFPELPIGVFLDTYFNYAYTNLYGGPSLLQEKELIIHVLPSFRYYYFRSHFKRMYASAAAGFRYRTYCEIFEGDRIPSHSFMESFLISPWAVSYGEHWTVSTQFGIGRPWAGFRICAGYKF